MTQPDWFLSDVVVLRHRGGRYVMRHAFATHRVGTGSLCGQARLQQDAPAGADVAECQTCLRTWRKRYP